MPDEKKPDIDPYLFKPVHMQDFKSLVKAIPKRIIGLISKACLLYTSPSPRD